MTTSCTQILVPVILLFVGFIYFYARVRNYVNYSSKIPRVGRAGMLGFLITALRYTLDAGTVIREGKMKYGDQPFAVPTLGGPIFLLRPEYLDKVRSSPDEVLNEPLMVDDDLQLPYTMDEHQLRNPYQATVLRTDVNRALPSYIPEMLDESILAIEDAFRPLKRTGKSLEIYCESGFFKHGVFEVPVFNTATHLIARISNRVIFGLDLCRNEGFLRSIVRFAETVSPIARFVKWTPSPLRPVTYFVLSRIFGGKREPLRYILPYLQSRIEDQKPLSGATTLVAEHLFHSAPPQETLVGLATRLLNINFGSIHTSSIFITQTLLEIALLDREAIESIRSEVQEALEVEGGWTKGALLKFKKIDSALREIGRMYGLMSFALPRYAMVDFDLGNGQVVPPGYKVAIDVHAVHYDPDVYPDPKCCDLFRFSKLREADRADSKYGFAMVDSHYLPWGAGRHACAGRFFAATVLKIMLARIILNFDISYPEGVYTRPKNILFDGLILPDPKAKLIFRRRPPHPDKVSRVLYGFTRLT